VPAKRLFAIYYRCSHTRRILLKTIFFSIKRQRIIEFLSDLFFRLPIPESVFIEAIIGSQFILGMFREYLLD